MIPPFLRKSIPCKKESKTNDCTVLNTQMLIGGSIAISLAIALILYGIASRIEHYKNLGYGAQTPSELFVNHPGHH